MKISKEGFGTYTLSPDNNNEETYFKHLEGIVESIDLYAVIGAIKKPEGIQIRITPSDYKSLLNVLAEVKKLNMKFGLFVEFSKSIKSSNNICYNIDFELGK